MTEHPELETPGGRIHAAREKRGLSLAALSDLTKIAPPVLAAIEADEYHKVSGALYIKSFLRSCATELGLEADEILDLYGRFSGDASANAAAGSAVWETEEVKITRVGLPWPAIAAGGLGLVLVGLGLLALVRGCGAGGEGDAGTAAVTSDGPTAAVVRDTAAIPVQPVAADGAATGPDTLAGQWNAQPITPEPEGAAETPVAVETAPRSLPLPLVGGPNLVFAGGAKSPVVVRLISEQPVKAEVKRDAEQSYTAARWPAPGGTVPPLPATGIEPGKAYAVGRGLVIYWGAGDHVSLRLDRTDGVEVTVNGQLRNLRNLRPGAEMLLDLSGH